MKQDIVQLQSDSNVAGVLKLIENIEKGLDKFGTTHRLVLNGELYLTDKELSERLRISRRTLRSTVHPVKFPIIWFAARCCIVSLKSRNFCKTGITEQQMKLYCNLH